MLLSIILSRGTNERNSLKNNKHNGQIPQIFKNGLVIEFNGDLFSIVEFQHVKPGKGPAFVRSKLKNLKPEK